MSRSGPKRAVFEQLAIHVAAGETLTEAARKSGCSISTAKRRAADPRFRRRVEQLRAALLDEGVGRLTSQIVAATDTFAALLADPAPQVRLAAARSILDYRSRLVNDAEFDVRLKAIEDKLRGISDESVKPAE